MTRFLLMTPGPTVVDPEVLLELARPTASHVSPEFDELHRETLEMLGRVFGTRGRVVLFPGSGTAAMELAVRSAVGPGERVLVLRAGVFGDYLAEAARSVGARVDVARVEPGRGFTASMLEELLSRASYSAVLFQHVDTSTSVANPVAELARVARRHGARVVVDGVASIGGMEMRMDEWGVDVCFTGSQKALATPPGLAVVAFREGFEPRRDTSTVFFNVEKLLAEMETTRNYYVTPAVNLVYGLNRSLRRIMEEGLEERYRRHRALAEAVQAGLEALGLQLVAEKPFRAHTVTAVYLPQGVEWQRLYTEARRRGVELAGGLGELKGRVFRIGHMGETNANDVAATMAVLERVFARLGYSVELGKGLEAMQQVLDRHGY
ncbi:alanine--glyoxylate aminotransferase family protein [Pyrodictium abyssi]|uniref:Alanine--glyoxylate aminotransferase family protein n=1 Tax=Pyrodictium abyssi TaxID=54256 RepID=A0ABN6ZLF5_9CREN|nr:alanine--glyoxylate aminotransferase family protein [Pyrodictium abyssi]